MAGIRPIPRKLLSDSMEVRVPAADGTGGFAETVRVEHVRYERTARMRFGDDAQALADELDGTIYVDAANSEGAFEVPAGSRISICGDDVVVKVCRRICGYGARVHHWELEVG